MKEGGIDKWKIERGHDSKCRHSWKARKAKTGKLDLGISFDVGKRAVMHRTIGKNCVRRREAAFAFQGNGIY